MRKTAHMAFVKVALNNSPIMSK